MNGNPRTPTFKQKVAIEALKGEAFSTSKCDKRRLFSAFVKDLYGCPKL